MQINNIKTKLKTTKEKTEVLAGRISPTKMVAFNMIAEIQGVSTADLFKATIDECIESFFKDMIMVETEKAALLAKERLDKLIKKTPKNIHLNSFTKKDLLTKAEQKMLSIEILHNFPTKIPLFWFFDEIRLDFNRQTEATNRERWIAYKDYLDKIERKEFDDLSELLDSMNNDNISYCKYQEQEKDDKETVGMYYKYIEKNEPVPKELKEKFNAIVPKDIKRLELLQYPFIKDSNGDQKYSDKEILKAMNVEAGGFLFEGKKQEDKFHSIQEVHNYMQEAIRLDKKEEEKLQKALEKFQEKLNVMGVDINDYSPKDIENIEKDPFALTNSFMSKVLTDDMIVRYWKYYMKDKKYFKNREISIESIKAYTLLKIDGILE